MLLLVWLIYGPFDRLIWLNIVSYNTSMVRDSIVCAMRRLGASVFDIDGSLDGTFTYWMVNLDGKMSRLQYNRGALIAGPFSRLRHVGFHQSRYRHVLSSDGMTESVPDEYSTCIS